MKSNVKEIQATLKKFDKVIQKEQENIQKINTFHSKLVKTPSELNEKSIMQLGKLYDEEINKAKEELQLIAECLKKIETLKRKRDDTGFDDSVKSKRSPSQAESEILQKYKGKVTKGSALPPLIGCVPPKQGYEIPEGSLVAAKISKGKDADWLLCSVRRLLHGQTPDKLRYEVEDVDESEDKKPYIVPSRNVIPLPKYEPPDGFITFAEFASGKRVLAKYPETTAFYPATVAIPPSKNNNKYKLIFEEDDSKECQVALKFVVAPPPFGTSSKTNGFDE